MSQTAWRIFCKPNPFTVSGNRNGSAWNRNTNAENRSVSDWNRNGYASRRRRRRSDV
jgi:hypothetical protein